MRGLAEFVLRHRKLVMVFWGLVLVAGIALAGQHHVRLTVDFSLPGQPGTQTADKIKRRARATAATPTRSWSR